MRSTRHTTSAAALGAAALFVSACSPGLDADGHGPGGDPSGSTATLETPPPSATQAPSAADAPEPDGPTLGEPRDLGDGVVIGSVPTGTDVWVTAPDPTSDLTGCEGVPFEFLWAVDVATGERVRAFPDLPDDDQPFVTVVRVSPDDPTQVVLVSGCEGFLGRIDVGTVNADGTITDVELLPDAPAELHGRSIRWNGPDLLVGAGIEAYGTPGLFTLDLDGGDWMDIDAEAYMDWVPLGDGLVAEVLFDQVRIVDEDGFVVDSLAANVVAPSRDGFPLLASEYDDQDVPGQVLLVDAVGSQRVLAETGAYGLGFSPDTTFATWTSQDLAGEGSETTILELATGEVLTITDPWFAGIAFLDGGVAYTREGPADANGFGTPTVTFRSWLS